MDKSSETNINVQDIDDNAVSPEIDFFFVQNIVFGLQKICFLLDEFFSCSPRKCMRDNKSLRSYELRFRNVIPEDTCFGPFLSPVLYIDMNRQLALLGFSYTNPNSSFGYLDLTSFVKANDALALYGAIRACLNEVGSARNLCALLDDKTDKDYLSAVEKWNDVGTFF